ARRSAARARVEPDHLGAESEQRQQVARRRAAADQAIDARRSHQPLRAGKNPGPPRREPGDRMILMKNVLVATDFGDASEAALTYGRALARTFGADLHLLHV